MTPIVPTLRVVMPPRTLGVQSRLKPVPLTARVAFSGTGSSREGVRRHTAECSVLTLAYSRLKPVPLGMILVTTP